MATMGEKETQTHREREAREALTGWTKRWEDGGSKMFWLCPAASLGWGQEFKMVPDHSTDGPFQLI